MKKTATRLLSIAGMWLLSASTVAFAGNNLSFKIKPEVKDIVEPSKTSSLNLASPASSDGGGVQLLGCIYASNAGNKQGIYRISTTEPTLEMLNDKPQATGGGTAGKDGKYYCQWYLTMLGMEIWTNMVFDTATWEWDGGIGQLESQAFDLAYDNATDRIYGCFFDPDENYKGQRLVFGWMDPATYKDDYAMVHPVCDLFECFSGLAFDGQGQLFALTKEGILYVVDKNSGERDAIGQTGLTPEYNSSAAIDPATGLMYYFLCTEEETALYTIDTQTAQATKIYVLPGGEQVQGLAIFEPQAAQGAPAPATNLATEFDGGNLSGTLNFTAPTKTYDGKDATGEISYKVSYRPYDHTDVSYEVIATGKTQFGGSVKAPVTLPDNGQYTFGVVLASASGDESPMAVTDTYVGFDTPLSPQDVKLEAEGNTLTLTWAPASMSQHNGYIDTEGMTYRIVRYPEEVVVAQSHNSLSFTETLATPAEHTRYHYSVVADNHGMQSFPQNSNFIALGSFSIPYLCDFESADEFAEFTVVTKESNPDNYYHWEYHTGLQAAHVGNGRVADDDILITPAVRFEGGKKYRVKVTVSNNNEASNARFVLKAGSAPTREAMNEYTLSDINEFIAKRPETVDFEALFTPEADGMYHLGIHSLALAESYDDLFLHSISVDHAGDDALSEVEGVAPSVEILTGAIRLSGLHGCSVQVYAMNGILLHNIPASDADSLFLPLPDGMYLVRAGESVFRVAIR